MELDAQLALKVSVLPAPMVLFLLKAIISESVLLALQSMVLIAKLTQLISVRLPAIFPIVLKIATLILNELSQ